MKVARIPLGEGFSALVDQADYERVAHLRWKLRRRRSDGFYAVSTNATGSTVYMHRLIAGTPAGMETDHRNGDGLDNRRANLRVATSSQNNANRRKMRTRGGRACVSRFKGVTWHPTRRMWWARISESGGARTLGFFSNEEDAARSYDAAADAKWGPFARLNFPRAGDEPCQ